MKIDILSHKELVQRAFQNTPANLIFISNPGNPFEVERSRNAVCKVANHLTLLFNDIESETTSPFAPKKQHVRDALLFSEGRNDLVVSCQMGVSRSAAIAFGIVAKRSGIAEAFQSLNPMRHSPNTLIVEHVQELLDLPFVTDAMKWWKSGRKREFDDCIAEHLNALRRRAEFAKLFGYPLNK